MLVRRNKRNKGQVPFLERHGHADAGSESTCSICFLFITLLLQLLSYSSIAFQPSPDLGPLCLLHRALPEHLKTPALRRPGPASALECFLEFLPSPLPNLTLFRRRPLLRPSPISFACVCISAPLYFPQSFFSTHDPFISILRPCSLTPVDAL
jgi:hypothetical protein